jgi:hypothetical protein
MSQYNEACGLYSILTDSLLCGNLYFSNVSISSRNVLNIEECEESLQLKRSLEARNRKKCRESYRSRNNEKLWRRNESGVMKKAKENERKRISGEKEMKIYRRRRKYQLCRKPLMKCGGSKMKAKYRK